MVKTLKPSPPRHLSNAARTLWFRLHDGHSIDDAGGLALLDSACEAFDRIQSARKILAAEGLVIQGRQGPRAHPASLIEHSARGAMHAALRLLRLSPEDQR